MLPNASASRGNIHAPGHQYRATVPVNTKNLKITSLAEHVSGAWAERKTERSDLKIGWSGAERGAGGCGAGTERGAG